MDEHTIRLHRCLVLSLSPLLKSDCKAQKAIKHAPILWTSHHLLHSRKAVRLSTTAARGLLSLPFVLQLRSRLPDHKINVVFFGAVL